MERLLECCLEKFPHVSSLKDEQKEAVIHLLRSKDVVAILPTGFGKSLIYQLYAAAKEMQIQDVVVLVVSPLKSIMMDQIEEMEELEIPSIVLSTNDDVLQKIGEAKYTSVGRARQFLMNSTPLAALLAFDAQDAHTLLEQRSSSIIVIPTNRARRQPTLSV